MAKPKNVREPPQAAPAPVVTGITMWDVIYAVLQKKFFQYIIGIGLLIFIGIFAFGLISGKVQVKWEDKFPYIAIVPVPIPEPTPTPNPVSCLWIEGQRTGNKCDFAVTAKSLIMVDAAGNTTEIPCFGPQCTVPPNTSGPLISPPGYTITRITRAE